MRHVFHCAARGTDCVALSQSLNGPPQFSDSRHYSTADEDWNYRNLSSQGPQGFAPYPISGIGESIPPAPTLLLDCYPARTDHDDDDVRRSEGILYFLREITLIPDAVLVKEDVVLLDELAELLIELFS